MSVLAGSSSTAQLQAGAPATMHLRAHIVVATTALSVRQPKFSRQLQHVGEPRLGISDLVYLCKKSDGL